MNTNRKIKFRAWDINNKRIVQFGLYSLLVDGVEGDSYWKAHYERGMIDLEVMQYTGIDDYSNIPIFEGDILEDGRVGRGVIVGIQSGLVFMLLSEYKDFVKGAPLIIYEAVADMQTSSFLNHCNVIGNIYQNPELLTN